MASRQLARVEPESEAVSLFSLPYCKFSPLGLELDESLSFDNYLRVGRALGQAKASMQWWIGDYLRFGERKYGESYAQAADYFGYDVQTITNCVFVASRFEIYRRRENLSWSHHSEVAGLDVATQEQFLTEAVARKLGKLGLRRKVAETKLIEAENITDDQPVQLDFARVRVRWKEVRGHLEQFVADFPPFERQINGWIGEMKDALDNPVDTGASVLEQLIDEGTWDIDGLVDATKYRKGAVLALCGVLVSRGDYEWRDKGGETEQARGARTKYIAPKGAPRGDYYEAYHGDRMSIIQDEDD